MKKFFIISASEDEDPGLDWDGYDSLQDAQDMLEFLSQGASGTGRPGKVIEVHTTPYGHLQKAMEDISQWSSDDAAQAREAWKSEVTAGIPQDRLGPITTADALSEAGPSPHDQWRATKNLLPELEAEHAAGDSKALFSALAVCARLGLPLPEWAGNAVIKAHTQASNYEISSWDHAFGAPYKKGAKIAQLRIRKKKERFAVEQYRLRRAAGWSYEEALWKAAKLARIGEKALEAMISRTKDPDPNKAEKK
tara:strand:- start:1182 stop:1934 length:753 start_codon:yes stop_codon:yes gene_type:complete